MAHLSVLPNCLTGRLQALTPGAEGTALFDSVLPAPQVLKAKPHKIAPYYRSLAAVLTLCLDPDTRITERQNLGVDQMPFS